MMNAYPLFPSRNATTLEGVWDFAFFEGGDPEDCSPDSPADGKSAVPGCFDTSPDLYGKRGTAIYSRPVDIAEDGLYRLRFGGLGLYGKVFWDGLPVDECRIPYSTFDIDIRATVGRHTLAVLICNRLDRPDLSPLFLGTDDYYGFGGIYRDITIEKLPDVPFLERVQVETLDLPARRLRLTFRFNGAEGDASLGLVVDGEDYGTVHLKIADGRARTEITCANAAIWSPETPALHILEASFAGEKVVERFGIRTIATCGQDILLNGEKIYLQGYNRHESHPEFGPVQTPQLMLDDLKWLKDSGANYIRCVHYQQDPRFFDLCDELGMLCWEESVGWGIQQKERFGAELADVIAEANRRMVTRNINNPSIIIWAFMNEGGNNQPESVPVYEKAVSAIHAEDTSRLVSYCCWFEMQERCRELCDVMSFHMYPGWIGVESTDFGPASAHFAESIKYWLAIAAASPASKDKPVIFSETGTCALYGYHDRDLAPWSEEFQADYDAASVTALLAEKRITGFTLWQFIDSKSFTRGPHIRGKARGFNCAGILDEYRRPKLAYDVLRPILRSHPVK